METVTIPKEKYDKLIRSKIIEAKENNFNFDEVFNIGSGKLKGQEVKDVLREEW
ncbi:hypothetical protein HYW19_02580 [Candidatus Woesearchaeota archaeon]|nr:hypothetical protein [Candidatus Woesearchaeota archaeon]